jgi:ATP-dependent Lon protease
MSAAKRNSMTLPFLPLRDVVVLPGMVLPVQVNRAKTIRLMDDVEEGPQTLALLTQTDPTQNDPEAEDFFEGGTLVNVLKKIIYPDGSLQVVVQGEMRFKVVEVYPTHEGYMVNIQLLQDKGQRRTKKLKTLVETLSRQFRRILDLVPGLPEEMRVALLNIDDPSRLADFVASALNFPIPDKIDMILEVDVQRRLEKLLVFVQQEIEMAELGHRIQNKVQGEISKLQREHYLHEQMKAIREELGSGGDEAAEIEELRAKVLELKLEESAQKELLRECDRLERMPASSSEGGQIRTWVESVVELPWNEVSKDNLNLKKVKKILDDDHSYLNDIKEHILEFLAVRKLKKDSKGSILCLAGPPGVGKTSLGRSIARAMKREFVRVSVGGLHDESEIRGHRRTYIGAMPGRIIKELKRCGTRNPVFMLDEVDKMGNDYRGDPSAALLEVLDSEQNSSFQDNYIGFPFDLSEVLFIATVNEVGTLPQALRDRMEVLYLDGYTVREKLEIAQKHLLPQALKDNGVKKSELQLSKKVLESLIINHTRESGVRQLDRCLGTLCRKVARRKVERRKLPLKVKITDLEKLLGHAKVAREMVRENAKPGVVTGMAWTPSGGMILNVESVVIDGSSRPIKITGQLGDVMVESANLADTVVRSRMNGRYDFDNKKFHLHVPAGAIPKDGPSAGITMAASLMSLIKGVKVDPTVALSGELTLSGRVLPVGGVKSKVMAAQRAGVQTVILCGENREDVKEIPEDLRKKLKFHYVKNIDQVFKILDC